MQRTPNSNSIIHTNIAFQYLQNYQTNGEIHLEKQKIQQEPQAHKNFAQRHILRTLN